MKWKTAFFIVSDTPMIWKGSNETEGKLNRLLKKITI